MSLTEVGRAFLSQAKARLDELLLEEPFVVVLPKSHPLAAQKTIDVVALQDEPLLFLDRNAAPGYNDALLGALSAAGLVLNIVQEFAELSTMVGLVASHLGLAIVPSSVAISLPSGTVARPFTALESPFAAWCWMEGDTQ